MLITNLSLSTTFPIQWLGGRHILFLEKSAMMFREVHTACIAVKLQKKLPVTAMAPKTNVRHLDLTR